MSVALAVVGAGEEAAASARGRRLAQIGWASGSLGIGAVFNVLGLFALFFMTGILGIPPAVAGAILFCSKIYDALLDPMIGAASDRTVHRWGPRRPYLLAGAVLVGITFALFFSLPPLGGLAGIIAAAAALLAFSTAYSLFGVPYMAMPPEIAPGYDERTRLMSFRVLCAVAGTMIGSAGGPQLLQAMGGGAAGYRLLAILLGALVIVMGVVAVVATARLPVARIVGGRRLSLGSLLIEPYRETIDALRAKPLRVLTIVKLCQLGVLAMVQACAPFFFTLVLGRGIKDIGIYLGVSVGTGIVALPLLRLAIGRFGKRRCYLVMLAGNIVALASWFAWTPAEPAAFFYVRAAVLGVLGNGTLLCLLSMLPDTMEHDRLVSGRTRGGVISGAFTFVEKLAAAFGPLVIGVMLQAAGLVQTHQPGGGQPPSQPASALLAVRIGMSLLPAALSAVGLAFLFGYRLDADHLAELRARFDHTPGEQS